MQPLKSPYEHNEALVDYLNFYTIGIKYSISAFTIINFLFQQERHIGLEALTFIQ